MEADVVLAKLESLSRCLSRIEAKKPESKEILETDYDVQDVIVLNLERSVQQVVDIGLHILSDTQTARPGSMSDVCVELGKTGIIDQETAGNLAKAVGFRNIAVHEYQSIDWNIVWSILSKHMEDFKRFSRQVLALLDNK